MDDHESDGRTEHEVITEDTPFKTKIGTVIAVAAFIVATTLAWARVFNATEQHDKELIAQDRRIRALEEWQTTMAGDLREIKTDGKWIRRQLGDRSPAAQPEKE